MAGRRPLPTNVLKMRGNPGRRPLNENEPTPTKGRPRCPQHLDDEAKREWKRVCDTLADMGLLTTADRAALAVYCVAWSRWVEAENNVRQFGMMLKRPVDKDGYGGFPVVTPYLSIANKAMEQMQRMLVEFGLTASSRSRLQVKPPADGDSFDAWERGEANG